MKMSKEFIQRWYAKIPELERDLPIIMIDNRVYTPREVYNEVMANTDLGRQMQAKLEKLASPYTFTYEDIKEINYIARKRVEQTIKNLPRGFSLVSIIDGQKVVWSPEQLEKSPLFQKAVEHEMRKVVQLLRRQGVHDENTNAREHTWTMG